jgi:hypothetical protein
MGHGGGAVATEAGQEATEMPYGQTQESGRFSGSEDPRLKPNEDVHAVLLLLVQGDRLPGHAPRVTKSLSRWGVTESLSYYTVDRRIILRYSEDASGNRTTAASGPWQSCSRKPPDALQRILRMQMPAACTLSGALPHSERTLLLTPLSALAKI